MTIENAKVLQERLADEAIAQVQVQGSKELADACIHSIGIVGKAWGIPADETANRQAHAQEKQTRRVGDVGAREDAADSGTRHSAPDWQRRPCRPYGNCLRQPLILTMTQTASMI